MESCSTSTLPSLFCIAATVLALPFSIHLKPCNGARLILAQEPASTQFISSCSTTTYPTLCFNSMSSHAGTIQTSPMQLAHGALSVTMDTATSTSATMYTMSQGSGMSLQVAAAMSDCMDTMGDSLVELKQSLQEMGHLRGGKDLGFQLNSIQKWVSTALTNDDTCMDAFARNAMDGEVKIAVRNHALNAAQLTSNALAFINALPVASHSSTHYYKYRQW